jgi:drug/metabolite transporter (DMT)-like permease
LGFVTSPLETWQPIEWQLGAMMFASALLVTLANVFIIRAFRGVDVTVVSPFRYFGVLWGILLGYLVWADTPNMMALFGTMLIVASGLYTMHRESLRLRQRS